MSVPACSDQIWPVPNWNQKAVKLPMEKEIPESFATAHGSVVCHLADS